MSTEVFVSYSRRDEPAVLDFVRRLRDAGFSVWIDTEGIDAARIWRKEIVEAIERSKVVVLMASRAAFESENVVRELALAEEDSKHILPVYLEPTRPPASLRYQLAGIQYVEFFDRDDEIAFRKVVTALTSLGVGHKAPPRRESLLEKARRERHRQSLPAVGSDSDLMYQQVVSEERKALIVFLIDTSASTEEPLGDSSISKVVEMANALNHWLHEIKVRLSDSDVIRDCVDLAVLSYGTDGEANAVIRSVPTGEPVGAGVDPQDAVISVAELLNTPARTGPDGQQTWLDLQAVGGGTPMCHVFHHAYELLSDWIEKHQEAFPPLVVHITDGESLDGDPLHYGEPIMELATADGNVLLANCFVQFEPHDSVLFPKNAESIRDESAIPLFFFSSVFPPRFIERANSMGLEIEYGARWMASVGSPRDLQKFLNASLCIFQD